MSRLATRLALSSVGLILALPIAKADIYQGIVTGIVEEDDESYGVEAGDVFEVNYLFDSDSPDLLPDEPDIGHYELMS